MLDNVEAAEEDLRASLPMTFKRLYSRAPCEPPSNGLPNAAAKLRASVVWLLLNNPRTRRHASLLFRRPADAALSTKRVQPAGKFIGNAHKLCRHVVAAAAQFGITLALPAPDPQHSAFVSCGTYPIDRARRGF